MVVWISPFTIIHPQCMKCSQCDSNARTNKVLYLKWELLMVIGADVNASPCRVGLIFCRDALIIASCLCCRCLINLNLTLCRSQFITVTASNRYWNMRRCIRWNTLHRWQPSTSLKSLNLFLISVHVWSPIWYFQSPTWRVSSQLHRWCIMHRDTSVLHHTPAFESQGCDLIAPPPPSRLDSNTKADCA